ncbi:MAG: class I SAM-dependent RNA methyltransferase [Rhodospirillales bacterium]|nr:class I SAM-dependent RNA methyltransferase [Rhodospirillales bacterium]
MSDGIQVEPLALTIDAVGATGDGTGQTAAGQRIFVPYALPGERVRAAPLAARGGGLAARLEQVLAPSPDRIAPACPHFGTCGGCALQHWAAAPYLAWKAALLREALARAGYADPPVAPTVATAPGARRRMDLALRRTGGAVRVGLHRARGAEVVDLAACPVLQPALAALIDPLRVLLRGLAALRREGSAVANLYETGPDLVLRTDAEASAADRARLVAFARAQGLPRLSWARGDAAPEPILVQHPPEAVFSAVAVAPPPGAFLQASATGEAAILAAVRAALTGPAGVTRLAPRARIIELYAGIGTLTFALAGLARVSAYEGDAEAFAALRAAAAKAGLTGRIGVERRDLTQRPLQPADFAGAAAVVLDPPQAGAAAQMEALAAAALPAVIYVSCNPATLARDAARLRAAGYVLEAATPIDQFLWSARLESVSVFRHPAGTDARGRMRRARPLFG